MKPSLDQSGPKKVETSLPPIPNYMTKTSQKRGGIGESDWDFYWCDISWMKEYFDHYYLEEHMKICHFRNHYELTRKNLMVKNLKRFRRQIERGVWCDFFPMTYELPSEYHIFVEEFKRNPGQIWIMKPIAKSQGKGIFLFRRLKDIVEWKKGEYQAHLQSDQNKELPETYVVQRYINNPYLIGGRKFDIRVYVLVTSKLAPDYDPEKGSKWSMQQLRRYMSAKHGVDAVAVCFSQMDDIFIKSLQSVQKVMINDKHCYELYGYDILLDDSLKPWLIEVNASPSLTASSKEDYDLKYGLLEDVLNVVDLENRLTGREKRVGGFDLLWDDGPIYDDDAFDCAGSASAPFNSFLGCLNDRRKQLKHLYKVAQASKKAPPSS
ncbi:hypothetical protein NP493_37g10048 [Ridgeia piscesae]|uniref:Tubulin--tyrosine ligase-like protein 9 n=1 Tax=Ridgeia piscesae TaxID=27915 RepID=A0AAD9PCH4_RIDPI|nr:hypothetical protein NP493_37g10048 [Ridgeia piscesae]